MIFNTRSQSLSKDDKLSRKINSQSSRNSSESLSKSSFCAGFFHKDNVYLFLLLTNLEIVLSSKNIEIRTFVDYL